METHNETGIAMLAEVEEILTWMTLGAAKEKSAVPLEFFDGAEPLHLEYLNAAQTNVREVLVAGELRPVPGNGLDRIDVAYVAGLSGGNALAMRAQGLDVETVLRQQEAHRLPGLGLNRMRSVSPKQCRGQVVGVWPHLLEWTFGVIDGHGQYRTNRMHVGFNGKRWAYLSVHGKGSPFHEGEALRCATFCCNLAFARRYDWRVCLGYEGGIAIAFVTDPVGAREVFRLRDIPDGRTRRAALRHWVEQHWRKKRGGDDAFVRSHLRGATSFTWNGLRCRIQPSAFDLERVARGAP